MERPKLRKETLGLPQWTCEQNLVTEKSPIVCPVTEEFLRPITYLPTPQVAAGRSLEYEDIIGVEGGGPGCNLKSFGVIGTCSADLKQPCGGHRLHVVISGGASLQA